MMLVELTAPTHEALPVAGLRDHLRLGTGFEMAEDAAENRRAGRFPARRHRHHRGADRQGDPWRGSSGCGWRNGAMRWDSPLRWHRSAPSSGSR